MALVACPDCQHNVSDAAPACPSCGRPIAPVQVEQTGKRFKGGMVVGIVMAIAGFLLGPVVGGVVPAVLLVGGVLVFVVSLLGAWWRHG